MIPHAILRQRATIETVAHGGAGPVFRDPVTVATRMEARRRMLARTDGSTIGGQAIAYLRPDVLVAAGDRFTCEGIAYRVLEVETARDLTGISHQILSLGRSES